LIKDSKIYAVGFGLDLTDRDLQATLKAKGLPWERAKAFDNSAVFSEFVPIKEEELKELSLKLYINDELKQEGGYELMMYKPKEIIEDILSFCTLEDGDIVMSGTPKGVGQINTGDVFRGEVYLGDTIDSSRGQMGKQQEYTYRNPKMVNSETG